MESGAVSFGHGRPNELQTRESRPPRPARGLSLLTVHSAANMPAVPSPPYQPEPEASTSSAVEDAALEVGFPSLSRSDVLACVFSAWYPTFRKHSPKATVIKPLKPEFIDYLQTDGVFLPGGSGPMG